MTDVRKKNYNKLINFSILSGTIIIGLAVAFYVYNTFSRSLDSIVDRGERSEYEATLLDQRGRRLSEKDGALKLVTDPFTIYRNYPNLHTSSYTIDEDGFRNSSLNPSATKLAFLVGGSAAFGQGLDSDDKTFASLINRGGGKYHIKNAAVVGHLSGQELALMVHHLDSFKPSLYIVFDGWNDIYEPIMHAQEWPVRNGPFGFNNMFFMIEDRMASMVSVPENEEKVPMAAVGTLMDENQYFQKMVEEYRSNIGKMAAFVKARGGTVLVVFQPELGNKKMLTEYEESMLLKWDKTLGYLAKEIPEKFNTLVSEAKAFCKKHEIDYIDINEIDEFTRNENTLFSDMVHPNELGHQVIAKIINKKLEQDY